MKALLKIQAVAALLLFFSLSATHTTAQSFDGNTYYRLSTQWQGDGKSLDVINDGKNNKLQLANTGNFSGQAWKITPLGNGFYRLTTQWQGDGKSLDVVNDGKNNQLQLAKTGNFSGQAWKITALSGAKESSSSTAFVYEMGCQGSKSGAKVTFDSKQGQTIKLRIDWNEGATFVGKTNLDITNGTCADCPTLGGIGGPHPKQATYTIQQTDASRPVTIKWGGNAGNIRYCGEDRALVIDNNTDKRFSYIYFGTYDLNTWQHVGSNTDGGGDAEYETETYTKGGQTFEITLGTASEYAWWKRYTLYDSNKKVLKDREVRINSFMNDAGTAVESELTETVKDFTSNPPKQYTRKNNLDRHFYQINPKPDMASGEWEEAPVKRQ